MTTLPARAALGAAAGVLATVPMTAFMTRAHAHLPPAQKEPLPPAKITRRLEEVAHVDDAVDPPAHFALTMANHFGYGGLCGAVFGALLHRPSTTKGVAFGLAVWTGSYLGWLPALRLHRSAKDEPAPRNALMIAAHVVFGGALGAGLAALLRRRA
jgi:hypothetical protein